MLYTPPRGALTLLSTATAAGVAAADFTGIDAVFDQYWLELVNVLPVTDGALLWLRTSVDGGATFDAGAADYMVGGGAAAQIALTGAASNLAARGGACGHLSLYAPADGAVPMLTTGVLSYGQSVGTATTLTHVQGRRDALGAVNAIRLMFNGGNIAAGKFKLYGVARA